MMTVACHIYDLKVSNKEPFEVTRIVAYLETIYRNKLLLKKGKMHDYLGMDLDYLEPGVVKVSMINYLKKLLVEFS